ncbi:hypothetical protein BSKO_07715 [Bryopsis sp. KO-2023]|nr:hypothetical protein BSKO_07715 [Bryopsis sp. KO-2023]
MEENVVLQEWNWQMERPKSETLKVKKLSEKARMPTKGSTDAAGYDLYSSESCQVPAKGRMLVSTDISMEIPRSAYGRIAPRSGLAAKHCIDVGAGVVDADYRGPVKVLLINMGEQDFEVKKGDRVAQLIMEQVCPVTIKEVPELRDTKRSGGGFGSTGLSPAENERRRNRQMRPGVY